MAKRTKELSSKDKKFIDLFVENTINKTGKVTEQDFRGVAQDLNVDYELIKNYADIVVSNVKPKEVEKVPVSPLAEEIRKQFSPREGMAIMTGGLSETIDKNPANFVRKGKNDDAIFRGNARPR